MAKKTKHWTFSTRAPSDLQSKIKRHLKPVEGFRLNQFVVRALQNEVARLDGAA